MSDASAKIGLTKEVGETLLPLFVARGFDFRDVKDKNSLTPFGTGRRKRDDGQVDLIEIQFDKWGDPAFVLNVGIAPLSGVRLPWGDHLTQDEVGIEALENAYRLYDSAIFLKWFKPGLISKTPNKVVTRCVERCGELERWFSDTRDVGKHMKPFGRNVGR